MKLVQFAMTLTEPSRISMNNAIKVIQVVGNKFDHNSHKIII